MVNRNKLSLPIYQSKIGGKLKKTITVRRVPKEQTEEKLNVCFCL